MATLSFMYCNKTVHCWLYFSSLSSSHVFPLFSLFQEEEHTLEECKGQEETARVETEEEALEAVRQKAAWSVKQPLCVFQMHVVVHVFMCSHVL